MRITATDQAGHSRTIKAETGLTLMEALREAELPIAARCGGCCSCATCHVYVGHDWLQQLAAKTPEEEDLLDLVPDLRSNSRLSCQIRMEEVLDGIEVTLAPGSEL